MKITKIVEAISTAIYKQTGIGVYTEDIDKIARPALMLKVVNVDKEIVGQHRQRLVIDWDLLYFPTTDKTSANMEIYDKIDELDEAFAYNGYKHIRIPVTNDPFGKYRGVVLENVKSFPLDNVGHYMFRTDFFATYGPQTKYELMGELELQIDYK